MNIGFTYDLRDDYLRQGFSPEETAEFDSQATIDAVSGTLEALGHNVEKIGNITGLVKNLARGKTWDLVFNICEGARGSLRESQVPALLDAYNIPYTFSEALVLGICLNKGLTKQILNQSGLPTARFAVVRKEEDLGTVSLPFPIFAKPVAEGTGRGIDAFSRIDDMKTLYERCRRLLAVYRQPVLLEEYLPGRELTVGILGTAGKARVAGVLEVTLREGAETGVYSYRNKEECEKLVHYSLADDPPARRAAAIALEAWRALECRDGGRVDIRVSADGTPCILELNPLAGLHPTDRKSVV